MEVWIERRPAPAGPGRRSARRRLAIMAAALAIAAAGCTSTASEPPLPSFAPVDPALTLRTIRPGSPYVGTAVKIEALEGNTRYGDVLAREFDSVTAEDAMKWETVEPARGRLDFSQADEIIALARAHGQKVRGHTLVWHSQLPDWLSRGIFGKAELTEILRRHIADEVGHFKGAVYAWDLVNEPFDDDGGRHLSIWQTTLGDGYIADALRWAHEADPAARLFINDVDIERRNARSDAEYALARSLKAEGVPIDGVGFQAHLDLRRPFPDDLAANLERFTDLGLEVSITELDVRMELPATPEKLARQADYYAKAAAACRSNAHCTGVTVWGFTDATSWVPRWFPGEGAACLFDESYARKPAYAGFYRALEGRR